MIYLDNAATTEIDPSVLRAMLPYLQSEYGNAGSLHTLGRSAANAIKKAREQVARSIGAYPEQIIFTSGGTEANNLVLKGLIPYLSQNNKKHIITSKVEHDSILNTVKEMNIKHGFDISFLNVNSDGEVINDLDSAIKPNTGLVSVMYINNEVGTINQIYDICQSCHEKNVLFHTDCVQALGSVEINVKKLDCDFMSISSHKIHGAKGVGALYVKHPELIYPLVTGGAGQEFGLRGGTENVSGIVGFGHACELLQDRLPFIKNHIPSLKCLFYNILLQSLLQYKLSHILHINGECNLTNASKILNLRFENIDAQTLVLCLDSNGVCASAGSACRNHESKPSDVLLSMGLSSEEAQNSVRFSFSHSLTHEQVFDAAQITASCIKDLYE